MISLIGDLSGFTLSISVGMLMGPPVGSPLDYSIEMVLVTHIFSFFRSGHRGSKAYSLWGGVVPSPSIGYDYL